MAWTPPLELDPDVCVSHVSLGQLHPYGGRAEPLAELARERGDRHLSPEPEPVLESAGAVLAGHHAGKPPRLRLGRQDRLRGRPQRFRLRPEDPKNAVERLLLPDVVMPRLLGAEPARP